MKFCTPLVTIGLIALLEASAFAEARFDTLKVGSTTYTNVVVDRASHTDLYFHHEGGVANVKLRLLAADLQKQFNYDSNLAAEAERRQLLSDEQFNRAAAKDFAVRVAQRRAEAEATERAAAEPPFTLADPINSKSSLNQSAPKLSVKKWLGDKPSVNDHKFTLFFFWHSQSLTCRQWLPVFNDLSKINPNKLTVIGVTTETEKELAELEIPVTFYSGSEPSAKYAVALGINSVPAVALIDPNGIVRYTGHPAALTDEALSKLMTRYAAE